VPPARRASSPHLLLVLGADSFRAEKALERALEAAVGPDRADAVEWFRGDETAWARVVDVARTPSLFAPRRAVVVRGAEALKGDGSDVIAYADDPTPGTVLILLAAKVDRRRNPWKGLCDRGDVASADTLRGRALRTHVVDMLREEGLPLGEAALDELLERVGQDLWRLRGELEKLAAFAGGRAAPLSAEEVAAVLGRGLAQPLY
jgi:DNA polymerase-3 subunit delta